MRFTVRRAQISEQLRDDFELYGKDVISLALGLGSLTGANGQFVTAAGQTVALHQAEAAGWLREKRDEEACQRTRIELLGWAILIFVIFGIAFYLLTLLFLFRSGE